MKLSKNLRYLVRVRDYETVHLEVGAEISHFDIGYDDKTWSQLDVMERDSYFDSLEIMLDAEVRKLAKTELEAIADWSEITPNLANDYLDTYVQRTEHATTAKKAGTPPASSRRIRRRGPTSPSPLKPA